MSNAHSPAHADAPVETRHGACNLCEAICGLTFQVQGNRIISVKGNEADPFSRGHICPKAVALKDLHEDPDRLKTPMRRVGDQWVPMRWDEAFDLVAHELVKVRQQHGANAVAVYQGNPSVHNWGNFTHGPMFFGQLKTRSRFSATSVDQLPHHVVAMWLYGHQLAIPIPDIDHTQHLLMLGANPLASNGSLMTVPDVRHRLKALKERGGKLVVVDPRRTETAAVADQWLGIRPGQDAPWLLALLHTLFDEHLLQPERNPDMAALLDGIDAVKAAVTAFSPEAVAGITGIDAATTRQTARDLAAADRGVVYGRMGVSTQENGVVCQWAIQVLNLLCGHIDREGGALLTSPAINLVQTGLMGKGHLGAWRSRVRGAPEFSGELPVSVLAEEMLTPGRGQIRALVTACGNPVLSTPNGTQLEHALQGLDFMVAIDFYLNETTRHAHVILPPTCFVEHDHYDLVFWHLAVRNATRYSGPIVERDAGTLHDWEIFNGLARAYAQRAWSLDHGSVLGKIKGRLSRSAMARLSPERLLGIGLKRAGGKVTLPQLKAHPEGIDLGPLRPSLAASLVRKKKRIGLMPPLVAGELPELAARTAAAMAQWQDSTASADVPLSLIGRRDVRSNNSWMHNSERLVSGKPRCTLWVNPADAAIRGLHDGQTITVRSRVGHVKVPVQVTEHIRPGACSLPHGWGHDRPGTRLRVASEHAGASINDLTDDRRTDALSGNAAFSGVPVTLHA